MKFWKMNGTGNDFILINNINEKIDEKLFPRIAKLLCRRHLSIGADGMMFIEKPHEGVKADFRMIYLNADGSRGEMCGNGARCLLRYGYENHLSPKGETITIETDSGIVTGRRQGRSNYRVRLADPSKVALDLSLELCKEAGYKEDLSIPCSYIELGVPGLPHLVVMCEDIARLSGLLNHVKSGNVEYHPANDITIDHFTASVQDEYPERSAQDEQAEGPALKKRLTSSEMPNQLLSIDQTFITSLGHTLRFHPQLPKGANVNFVQIIGENHAYIRTYERGVEDFTYSCGTGTASAACALAAKGLVKSKNIMFDMTGGKLSVDIEKMEKTSDGAFFFHGLELSGPTNVVAKGYVSDENLDFM